MKKLFSLLLAMLMLASVGVFAFADGAATSSPWRETSSGAGEGSFGTDDTPLGSLDGVEPGVIPVYGTYSVAATEAPTYVVDVAWSGLSFTYHAAEKTGWNPNTLQYSNTSEAHWSSDGANGKGSITLTNKSNADVNVTLAYAADDSHNVRLRYTRTASTSAEALSGGGGSNFGTIYTTLDGPGEELEGYVPTPVTYYFMPNKQDSLTDIEGSGAVSLGTITITISAATGDPGLPGPGIFD